MRLVERRVWSVVLSSCGGEERRVPSMTVSGLLNGLPGFVATSEAGPADSSESSLFADEKLLLGERTVPSRRLEFALGRTAARRALVGLGMEPAPILRGASGEPGCRVTENNNR